MTDTIDYEVLAQLFTATYAETHSIPDALRVVVAATKRPHSQIQAAGLNSLVAAVARQRGLRPQTILSRNRSAPVTQARAEVWWVLSTRRGLSQDAIGAAFDRDPSTVGAVVRRVDAAIETDPELRARVAAVDA